MTIGVDVYSGNGHIDWDRARASGNLGFVGVRATYGVAMDSLYLQYRADLAARQIATFAYGFLRFGDPKVVGSPEDQGHALVTVIGAAAHDQRELTPAIDLEFPGGKRPDGMTAGEALAWFLRCYVVVKAGLGGADPGVYTSQVAWNDPDQLAGLSCPELADAWSWMKFYPEPVHSPAIYDATIVNAMSPPPVAPPFEGNWNLHQYMGDATSYPGISTYVDMNRTRIVQQGDSGGRVRWVQRKLKITADGIFGPITDRAVRTFQAAHFIGVDGRVGYVTSACLSRVV